MAANITLTSNSGGGSSSGKPPKLIVRLIGESAHPSISPGDPSDPDPDPLEGSDDYKKAKYVIYRCLYRGLTFSRVDAGYFLPTVTLLAAPSSDASNEAVNDFDHYFKEKLENGSNEIKTFRNTLRSECLSKYNEWTSSLQNPMIKTSEAFKRYTEIYEDTFRRSLASWTAGRIAAFRAGRTDSQEFGIEYVDKKSNFVKHIPTHLHSEVPEAISMSEYEKGVNDDFQDGRIRASILSQLM